MPNIQKVDVEAKQLKGLKIRTCNADECSPETQKIGALWGQFIGTYAPSFPHYGVYFNYESDLRGMYDLLAGVESGCDGCPDTVQIQEGRYLKFSTKGELHEAVMQCWKQIWAYFEDPSVDERRAYETDFEVYSSPTEVAVYVGVHYF